MSTITTTGLLSTLLLAQLPRGKKDDDTGSDEKPKTKPEADTYVPRNKQLDDLRNKTFGKPAQGPDFSKVKGFTIDPKTNLPVKETEKPKGFELSEEDKAKKEQYVILTRSSNIPIDPNRPSNPFTPLFRHLTFIGGMPDKSSERLAEAARKLELKPSPSGNGTLISDKYSGTFILQFQDTSIFVKDRKDDDGKPLPNVTYVESANGKLVLDTSRTEPLFWTEPLTYLAAYKTNLNAYAIYIPEEQLSDRMKPVELLPQADGTIYDQKSRATLVKSGDGWKWDFTRKDPLQTTHIVRNERMIPMEQMTVYDFQELTGYHPYTPPKVSFERVDTKYLLSNSKNCLAGCHPGTKSPATSDYGGFKLSLRGYDESSYDSLLRPSGIKEYNPDPNADKLIAQWIKSGKLPANSGTQSPKIQAFKSDKGYYIVTSTDVFFFDKAGTAYVYDFNIKDRSKVLAASVVHASDNAGRGFVKATGSSLSRIDAIVKYGNVSQSQPLKLASTSK